MAAQDLLELEDVPGGLDTWLEMKAKMDEEEEARPAKRKRVHKQRFPKALIDHLASCPPKTSPPFSYQSASHKHRQLRALSEFVDGKMRPYEQALIDQYNAQGYAEDEREVSDSEEEEDVAAEN